jgi:hypothetical protein
MTVASTGAPIKKPHVHRWTETAHLDGCHYYTTAARCVRCGATYTASWERDPNAPGSMAAVWMEPQLVEVRRDERGRFVKPHWVEKPCDRCRELQAGATPRRDLVVVDRRGNVIREEHEG